MSKVCLRRIRDTKKPNLTADSPPINGDEEVPAGASGPNTHFSHYVFQKSTNKQTQTETIIRVPKPKTPSPGPSKLASIISSAKALSARQLNVTLLLDCGCSTNVVTLDAVNEAGITIRAATNVSLVDAAGAAMRVSGKYLIKVEVPSLSKAAYISFLISPDLPHKEEGMIGKSGNQDQEAEPKAPSFPQDPEQGGSRDTA
jgi:hypothetical protein